MVKLLPLHFAAVEHSMATPKSVAGGTVLTPETPNGCSFPIFDPWDAFWTVWGGYFPPAPGGVAFSYYSCRSGLGT